MSRVITFSRTFPTYHPKKGQNTDFVEKLSKGLPPYSADEFTPLKSDPKKDIFSLMVLNIEDWADLKPKYHTIRSGHRWKVGEKFSPRVWSGRPYASKMITIAPDIEIKKIIDIKVTTEDDDGENDWTFMEINGKSYTWYAEEYVKDVVKLLALNDGFNNSQDLWEWLVKPRTKQQRLDGTSSVFDGQIICWNESINY